MVGRRAEGRVREVASVTDRQRGVARDSVARDSVATCRLRVLVRDRGCEKGWRGKG